MGEMRHLIRNIDYATEAGPLRDFVIDSKLKMSTFEYVYRNKKLLSALELAFNRDGLLENHQISEGQRDALTYLIGRFKHRSLTTRSDELKARNPACDVLAARLAEIVSGRTPDNDHGHLSHGSSSPENPRPTEATGPAAPGRAGGRGSTVSSADNGTGSQSGVSGSERPTHDVVRGPNRGDTRSRLDMSGFQYAGTSVGLRRRFEELREIGVRRLPNATHDLLRSVLEGAIKDYFRSQGKPESVSGKQLGKLVDALHNEFKSNRKMTGHINQIKATGRMDATRYAGSTFALNSTNHEPDQFVVHDEVHAAWGRIKPILIEIVGEKPTQLTP